MKRKTSFLAGVVSTLLFFALGTTALAASGKVTFSFSNIALNGETKIAAGSSIQVENGQKVPGSILYIDEAGGKTHYLPIRAICELLGVDIDYDSASKTVHLYLPSDEQKASVVGNVPESFVAGNKDLVLARGGKLLPGDSPESYVSIEGVYYKLYEDKNGILRKEYDLGNRNQLKARLWEAADKLVNGEYPVNSKGESYGERGLSQFVGYDPVLSVSVGTNGMQGYIRESEIAALESLPAAECPHEFFVNLYKSDGETVIGEFSVSCGGHFSGNGMMVEEVKEQLVDSSVFVE